MSWGTLFKVAAGTVDDVAAMANSASMEGRGLWKDYRNIHKNQQWMSKVVSNSSPLAPGVQGPRLMNPRSYAAKMFAKDAGASLKSGAQMSYGGSWKAYALLNVPLAAFSAASAPRGRKMSAASSSLFPMVGSAIGMAVGGVPGALAGGILVDSPIAEAVTKGVQAFNDFGRDSARLHTGDFQDSQQAWTMRQRASVELAGSLTNARQYLGLEAAYLHS